MEKIKRVLYQIFGIYVSTNTVIIFFVGIVIFFTICFIVGRINYKRGKLTLSQIWRRVEQYPKLKSRVSELKSEIYYLKRELRNVMRENTRLKSELSQKNDIIDVVLQGQNGSEIEVDKQWMQKKDLLDLYIKRYNKLPKTDEVFYSQDLGNWVRDIINDYHNHSLPDIYIKALNEIGFFEYV